MSDQPQPRPGVLDLVPYIGGESKVTGVDRVLKLSSNEGALGPSPKALAALREAAVDMHRYPEGGCTALRRALGQHYGLDADRIVCGAGSDDLITLLVRAYCGPGDNIVYSAHGFLMYALNATAVGAAAIAAPEQGLRTDVDALLAAVTPLTRIVFVANPNNPTGSYITHDELNRLHAGLRPDILLVVDAAYAEYVRRNDYPSGLELVGATGNTVVLRTFSKIFAMGGLRLGWAYCPVAVADVLNRIRNPFNVSNAAQAAGIAALADVEHVEATRANNDQVLPWFARQLERLGLRPWPSVGNFVLVQFADAEPGRGAEDARLYLKQKGILVRQMEAYGLPDCLRITIGTQDEMNAVVAHLQDWVEVGVSG
jgi:histidinol-phosphate aminotransferase